MRRGMRITLAATAGLLTVLGLLVPAAGAEAGGATLPTSSGGAAFGAPLKRALPSRPVATMFSVRPRVVVSPTLPRVVVRVDQPGAATVRARVVLLPLSETGALVRLDLGRVRSGAAVVAPWPKGLEVAPGRYLARLHVRGAGGAVLARDARFTGRAVLSVRAPRPAPAPPAALAPVASSAGVFPVAGPHSYGDGIGAARDGHTHQGQDIGAAEGTPVVAPVAGVITFTDYQAKGAGYYVVQRGADGHDFFFAHCAKGSVIVAPGQVVTAGQPLCAVGTTGRSSGAHLHFEAWENGWRVDAASRFVDPLPLLRAWDTTL